MPRTDLFILTRKMERAIRDSRIPIARLAPMVGLHVAQMSRALANDPFGPVLLERFETLGESLGVNADDVSICIEGER